MTASSNRKRLVRQRMQRTGESYTAALRHLRSEGSAMSTQQKNVNVTAIVRKTLRDQPVLCVRSTQTEIGVIGEALDEAWQAGERQGLASAGPPYTLSSRVSRLGSWSACRSSGRSRGPSDSRRAPWRRGGIGLLLGQHLGVGERRGGRREPSNRSSKRLASSRAGPLRWIWLTAPEPSHLTPITTTPSCTGRSEADPAAPHAARSRDLDCHG